MNSSAPRSLLAALLALSAAGSSAFAADYYWGQTAYSSGSIYTGDFATAGNWFTTAAGTTGAGAAPSTLDDDVFFNTTAANTTGGTVTVGANITAKSLTFNTSGATVLSQDANRNLVLGSGGITLGTDSGNVNIGINVNALSVRLAATQTWTNNSASTLNVRSITTNSGAGAVSLTLNAAGAGNIDLPLSVAESGGNALSIIVASTGSGTVNMAASAYSGGTKIHQGTLRTTGTIGTGAIELGNTSGSTNASLTVHSSTFANNIVVKNGSSGIKTLTTSLATGALSGTLTLEDNLALSATGALTTFSGTISGTGDIVKTGIGALTFSGANTFSGDLTLNTGAFTLAETGSLTFHLGANGVTNQVNGATTGAVAFNGTFNLNLSGATLSDGNSWALVSLASTAETYGTGFAITGFTQNNDIWTNGSGFSFNEATGILSYSAVPEPSTYALLGGFATLLAAAARRRART